MPSHLSALLFERFLFFLGAHLTKMIVSDDATAHLSALLLELVSLGEHLLILLLVTNYLLLGHYNHIITTIVD